MAAEPTFYKFPKTPHVEGSSVVDDDKSVTFKSIDRMVKAEAKKGGNLRFVADEKVDGANVGVHFEQEWVPILQKRSNVLQAGEKHAQYNVFRDWGYEHMEALFSVLGTEYVLFGEWMWATHSVSYDALESYFVAFDVLEKASSSFLSRPRMAELLAPLASGDDRIFPIVPVKAQADATSTKLSALLSGLDKETSAYTSEPAEGVYIRLENDDVVLDRFKLRRDTFVAGRADFGSRVVNNTLAS